MKDENVSNITNTHQNIADPNILNCLSEKNNTISDAQKTESQNTSKEDKQNSVNGSI